MNNYLFTLNARRFILCVGLTACTLAASDAVPHTNERSLTFVALDRKGAPVTDLSTADFQIFDEGKPQQIASFRADSDRTSVILIVFDLLNAIPSQRAFTRASIVHALEPLEDSDSLYFYILTNQGSLYPIRALPAVRPTLLRHKDRENNERVARNSSPWTRKIHPLMDQALEQVVQLRPRDYRDTGMEASTTFRALATLGTQLAPLDGDKSILWISPGTPNMLAYPFGCRDVEFAGESGNYLAGKCRDNCPWLRSGNKCVDYTPFLEHFTAELDRSGTICSSVEEIGSELATDRRGSRTDTLRQLANLTGGRKYPPGDIKRAIAESLQGGHGRYRLTYQAPPPDGKYHGIRVFCRRKGVRIQAPERYYAAQQ